MNFRTSLGVAALCLASCGGPSAPRPTPSTSTVAATVPPPTQKTKLVTPDAARCGGFEQLPLAAKKLSLLGERLLITPLAGLKVSARPHDIMAAPAATEHETRLVLNAGEHKLVIVSEEMFARAPADLVGAAQRTIPILKDVPGEEQTLGSGLRAAVFVQRELDATSEAVALAHAVTVLPDDTLQVTHVIVSPSVVQSGSGGCRTVALKLLGSLEAGQRKLDLAGGRRQLASGYSLQLPESFALTPQQGPDFTVFRVARVLPLGQSAGQLGMYFGHHPDFEPDPSAKKLNATILGQPTTWYRTQSDSEIGQEALLKRASGLAIHVFLAAPNEAAADELARVAATLRD